MKNVKKRFFYIYDEFSMAAIVGNSLIKTHSSQKLLYGLKNFVNYFVNKVFFNVLNGF